MNKKNENESIFDKMQTEMGPEMEREMRSLTIEYNIAGDEPITIDPPKDCDCGKCEIITVDREMVYQRVIRALDRLPLDLAAEMTMKLENNITIASLKMKLGPVGDILAKMSQTDENNIHADMPPFLAEIIRKMGGKIIAGGSVPIE